MQSSVPLAGTGAIPESIYLRLSVTSACNLHCEYCRPDSGSGAIPAAMRLSDEEIVALVALLNGVAPIRKLRLTGGEPLLRGGLHRLIAALRGCVPAAELCMTTNGLLLEQNARSLRAAGLDSVNVSLDAADSERFRKLTRIDGLTRVLAGLDAARGARFDRMKINTVLIESCNGDQLDALIRIAARNGCEIRFVELMPFGEGARLYPRESLSADAALERITSLFEYRHALEPTATAERHEIVVDGKKVAIGFITSVSRLFCEGCDRIRLDSVGRLFTCLRAERGIDVGAMFRAGDADRLKARIAAAMARKVPPAEFWPVRSMAHVGG